MQMYSIERRVNVYLHHEAIHLYRNVINKYNVNMFFKTETDTVYPYLYLFVNFVKLQLFVKYLFLCCFVNGCSELFE